MMAIENENNIKVKNINVDMFIFAGTYSHHVIQKGPLRMEKLYSTR